MMTPPVRLVASPFARLPEDLWHDGPPTEWVRVTRPGQRLHSFLEGPCFDGAGNLWLVDVPYGRIFRIDSSGAWTCAHSYEGEPHAIRQMADGSFVIADHRRGLLSFDARRRHIETICAGVNSEPFRGLGDLAVAPNGDLWFTDPGRSSLTDPTGRVFRLRADSARPEVMLANVPYPNGISLTADARRVLVSATRANAVWSMLADAPDPLFPMAGVHIQLSGGLGPDGLAVDRAGRLAVAQAQAGRAYVFNAMGDLLAEVGTPGGTWTTACAFSADGRELFIIEAETATVFRAGLDKLEGTSAA